MGGSTVESGRSLSVKPDDPWVKADDLGSKQTILGLKQTIFWAKADYPWVEAGDPDQSGRSQGLKADDSSGKSGRSSMKQVCVR